MRNFLKASLVGLLFIHSIVGFAIEPTDGWYWGITGFGSYAPPLYFNMPSPALSTSGSVIITPNVPGSITYNLDGGGALELGFRCDTFRFGGELLFNINTYKTLSIGGISVNQAINPFGFNLKGYTALGAALFNAYYDFNSEEWDSNFVPYVGVGVGYSDVRNNLNLYYNQTSIASQTNSNSVGIGQIIGGISYYFDESIYLSLDYRYVTTAKITDLQSDRIILDTLNISLNFAFDCATAHC